MQRNNLRSFDEGLQLLQHTNDFATLRDVINEMIYICPPDKSHLAKDRIARIMRRKQAFEIQQASNFPDALAAIDQKFKDLAIVLKYAESAGMQIRPMTSGFNGQPQAAPHPTQAAPQPAPQPVPQPAPKPAPMAKTMPSSMMGLGLKPLLLLNWVKSKKDMIIKGAAIATVAGGTYFVLNKYFGSDDKKKNPKDKESDFDRTIRSIQKYRAFSRLTKDPDFGDEYLDALIDGKKKKKKKTPAKKETSKLDEWEKEEDTLMKSMTATHKALAERPTSKFSLPKLPAPKDNPVPVIGSTVETPKKKKKKKSSPKEESTISEEPVEEVVEVKEAPKTREPKKKRSSSKKRKAAAVGTAPGRLIPIVKRTKRVRKIS